MEQLFTKSDNSKKRGVARVLTLRQFEKAAARKLKRIAPEGCVIVKFDIDRFTELRGRYGSIRTEELLDELTQAIAQEQGKAVKLFARLPGEKFLLLAQNSGDFMQVLQDDLARAVTSVGLEKYVGKITFSFGLYEVYRVEETVNAMIDKASIAHKTAAKNKHKTIMRYDAELAQALEQENFYNEHLLEGIERGEFKVYLQQQVSFAHPEELRAKALVRWALDNGRLVYPGSFIAQFEHNGMMAHLDFHILEQVCRYLQTLSLVGKQAVAISVSISPVTLFDPSFMVRFARLVAQYQVRPETLVLEIQHAELVEGEPEVLAKLEELSEHGFVLAAESVTSAQANLRLLAVLPLRVLKIGRQFIRAADGNDKIKMIISGVVALAHKLSMQVFCEGVEHQSDINVLHELGCDVVQGYFLMQPAPKEDFLRIAEETHAALVEKLDIARACKE